MRSWVKRSIAGLVVVSLVFHAALLAAQLSILIASSADAAAALPASIICTDHGIAALPSDETPADRPRGCGFCPVCSTLGAGLTITMPAASFGLVERSAKDIVFHFSADSGTHEHFIRPRSRGPPALA